MNVAGRLNQRLLFSLLIISLVLIAFIAVNAIALTPRPADKNCQDTGKSYTMVIKNDAVSPPRIDARQCDRLTIRNDDDYRLIAFGPHEEHVTYDGITERALQKNRSFTITLVKTGVFRFHDHEQDEVAGTFSVRAKN